MQVTDLAASAPSTSTASSAVATQAVDELGSFGRALTAYHVGDLTGIVGLLLTVGAAWISWGARKAARQAAAAAIASRNRLELAAKLGEMVQRLRAVRQIYQSLDWTELDARRDAAVAIAVEVGAAMRADQAVHDLMERIRSELREPHTDISQAKDEGRRLSLQGKLANRTAVLADAVERLMHERVKHGT